MQQLLAEGADQEEIARLLVATSAWTPEGAKEIVLTFADVVPARDDSLEWPGPFEEVPPLFAS